MRLCVFVFAFVVEIVIVVIVIVVVGLLVRQLRDRTGVSVNGRIRGDTRLPPKTHKHTVTATAIKRNSFPNHSSGSNSNSSNSSGGSNSSDSRINEYPFSVDSKF